MERFSIFAAAALLCLAGCSDRLDSTGGRLLLGFAEPVEVSAGIAYTRSESAYDTNAFILSIKSNAGDTIYHGSYGGRPQEIILGAGTYEISVASLEFDAPAFDCPVYGDNQMVVISGGKPARVSLLCKLVNAGIQVSLTDNFKKRYSDSRLLLRQESGQLDYTGMEGCTGYFIPGNVAFVIDGRQEEVLFNRVVTAGQIHRLALNASCNESEAGFSIAVDDTAEVIEETITVGDQRFEGADGSSPEKALDVATASARMGDTLWVWGYIVGGDLTASGISFKGPYEKDSNIAIASRPGVSSRSDCFSVELSKASIKEALNLVGNPGNLGKKVFLRGIISEYFSMPGIKKVTEYTFEGI